MVDIRAITPEDLDRVWQINQAEVPAVGSVTPAELAAIVDQACIALVALDGDTIGGFCLVLTPDAVYGSQNFEWFKDRFDDFVYLDRIAIAPEYQRQGWGHQLYAHVERLAKQALPTATLFTLEVNLVPRNDQSLAFHDQMGFHEVGVRTPNPEYSVSMMAKQL